MPQYYADFKKFILKKISRSQRDRLATKNYEYLQAAQLKAFAA